MRTKAKSKPGKTGGRDITQYMFNRSRFSKRRLVVEVIRKYTEDHPEAKPADIQENFKGLVKPAKEANPTIYFTDKDSLVTVGGKKFAVYNQITGKIIDGLIAKAKEFGMKITAAPAV